MKLALLAEQHQHVIGTGNYMVTFFPLLSYGNQHNPAKLVWSNIYKYRIYVRKHPALQIYLSE